jgi:hypothetical protein
MSNSDTSGFGKFVPGFDFLQNLAKNASSGLSGGAFAMEASIGGEILAPRKGPAPDTATFLISAKTMKDRRVLPISLRSTTGSPGPGKAPN